MAYRKTKLVVTIGPASRDTGLVRRLIGQVDVFRINFSHGDLASHRLEIQTIRRASRKAGRPVAILQDLPGPKIRVGRMRGGSVDLTKGSPFFFTAGEVEGNETTASLNYPDLLKSLRKGDTLHLADGLIRLRVERIEGAGVTCTVLNGGTLASGKGVSAPGVRLKVDYPTKGDVEHMKVGARLGVDFVALSFVRSSQDVRAARKILGPGAFLVSKVEKREAVADFEEILTESDGVMVARGDLGIDVAVEKVPLIQKQIVSACNRAGKPVIVATQMLMSMVNFPVPTRAEVTDVSTAILDGADAVMLSDETAVGKYPVEAVLMLDRIARSTEKATPNLLPALQSAESRDTAEAIGRAACGLADYVGARAIIAPTQTGSTAKRVAMFRPRQPIVAICTDGQVARRMRLYRGVIPILSRKAKTTDWLFARAEAAALKLGLASRGERIVVTSGSPGMKGTTDLIKVSVVGGSASS